MFLFTGYTIINNFVTLAFKYSHTPRRTPEFKHFASLILNDFKASPDIDDFLIFISYFNLNGLFDPINP